MFVLITLILLFLAVVTLVALRLIRPAASYAWLVAALGALLAWISVFFWQMDLPRNFLPGLWTPLTLFSASPLFLVDSFAWLYALSLTAQAVAVIWTAPARGIQFGQMAWAGALAMTALGLLAVLAGNLLTLVLVWTALDLTEIIYTLRNARTPELSERAVLSFSLRAVGTGFAQWASVISAVGGQAFSFAEMPAQAGIFLLLAVGLRLGVLPLHLTYRREPALRRGFGTSLRLTTAASSLVVLVRIPVSALEPNWALALLALTAIAAFYGSWKWFTARDELSARPYWLIGMGALSLAAALRGNSLGSAAWGAALLIFGGMSFLYSAKQIWFSRVLAGLGLALLGLPFTLTASGWQGDFPLEFVFWPLFLTAHAMLVAGYVRHTLRPVDTQWTELLRWAQAVYPLGLAVPVITLLVGGLWGWPGALTLGVWTVGLGTFLLSSLLVLVMLRLPALKPVIAPAETEQFHPSRFTVLQDGIASLFWGIYRLIGRLFTYVSNLLEGDGGLLWTLLLLVLLASFLRGR